MYDETYYNCMGFKNVVLMAKMGLIKEGDNALSVGNETQNEYNGRVYTSYMLNTIFIEPKVDVEEKKPEVDATIPASFKSGADFHSGQETLPLDDKLVDDVDIPF